MHETTCHSFFLQFIVGRQHYIFVFQCSFIIFFSGAEVRFRPPAGFYLEKFKKSLGNFLKDKQLIDVCIDVLILPVKVYYVIDFHNFNLLCFKIYFILTRTFQDNISITVSLQEYELSTLNVQITVSDSITGNLLLDNE